MANRRGGRADRPMRDDMPVPRDTPLERHATEAHPGPEHCPAQACQSARRRSRRRFHSTPTPRSGSRADNNRGPAQRPRGPWCTGQSQDSGKSRAKRPLPGVGRAWSSSVRILESSCFFRRLAAQVQGNQSDFPKIRAFRRFRSPWSATRCCGESPRRAQDAHRRQST